MVRPNSGKSSGRFFRGKANGSRIEVELPTSRRRTAIHKLLIILISWIGRADAADPSPAAALCFLEARPAQAAYSFSRRLIAGR